jgi:hypothetical protein
MTTREQIIEILEKNHRVSVVTTDYGKTSRAEESFDFQKSADEILALPLYPDGFLQWLRTSDTLDVKINDWIRENISTKELYEYWKNLPK